jgi:cell wall-associated NlpC family hydrolase
MPCRWDSRECPGPISEATLHCPSACRALTAGAIALAVVTPVLEPGDQANADAQQAVPPASAAAGSNRAESAHIDPEPAFLVRAVLAQRASRSMRSMVRLTVGRAAGVRDQVTPDSRRPAGIVARPARGASAHRRHRDEQRSARSVRSRTSARRSMARRATRHAAGRHGHRVMRQGNMTAVIAFARSQVGRRYVSGGAGAGGFDCSGLTMSAYARAGIRLPHSSGRQAARARGISRDEARAGDLVVGPGHVGIYMGHGMMIDAGNYRTGVVYRKLYSGLRVERF